MTEMRDISVTWSRSVRIARTRLRVIVRESLSPLSYARRWIYSVIESVDALGYLPNFNYQTTR
jgi:hypothetical protein